MDRHKNRNAAWWREYRQKNRLTMRTYSRERWRRIHGSTPRSLLNHSRHLPVRKYRIERLAALQSEYAALDQTEIEKAMLNPELAELIKAQAKDARSFKIKHDLSYDESAPEWENGCHTVYSMEKI